MIRQTEVEPLWVSSYGELVSARQYCEDIDRLTQTGQGACKYQESTEALRRAWSRHTESLMQRFTVVIDPVVRQDMVGLPYGKELQAE